MSSLGSEDIFSSRNCFVPVIGTSVVLGKRASQQDRILTQITHLSSTNPIALVSVFDGHGTKDLGHVVADKCSKTILNYFHKSNIWYYVEDQSTTDLRRALNTVVENLESDALELNRSHRTYAGTTLCAVIVSTEMIVSVNVGDSRAVLVSETETNSKNVTQVTQDHNTSNKTEKDRVLSNGGWISNGSVNGYISMTRAIGDADVKEHRNETKFLGKKEGQNFGPRLIISDPDISFFEREKSQKFLIVATDGVWGTMSNDLAVQIVDSSLRRDPDPNTAASTLINRVISSGSTDNCSAVVVLLSNFYLQYKNSRKKYCIC